ncbi:hypothetical protein FB451DRAFT_1177583 [Mycena latifolia]|nr:hypothetical protein FB451DRAFT_1177583 [Mycena latifolia]
MLFPSCSLTLEQAHNVTLFSTTVEGLQRKLNLFFGWRGVNFRVISATKTEWMLFGELPSTIPLMKASKARTVTNTTFGAKTTIGCLPPYEGIRLYNARIDLHLTFGSEVCLDVVPDHLKELTDVQHEFTRRLLGVHSHSILSILSTETGVTLLAYRRPWLALGYLIYLITLPLRHLAKAAYLDSLLLSAAGHPSWFSDLRFVLQRLLVPIQLPHRLLEADDVIHIRTNVTAACVKWLGDLTVQFCHRAVESESHALFGCMSDATLMAFRKEFLVDVYQMEPNLPHTWDSVDACLLALVRCRNFEVTKRLANGVPVSSMGIASGFYRTGFWIVMRHWGLVGASKVPTCILFFCTGPGVPSRDLAGNSFLPSFLVALYKAKQARKPHQNSRKLARPQVKSMFSTRPNKAQVICQKADGGWEDRSAGFEGTFFQPGICSIVGLVELRLRDCCMEVALTRSKSLELKLRAKYYLPWIEITASAVCALDSVRAINDIQYWARRRLGEDDDEELLDKLYT